jgi:hypothetical protein
MRQRPGARAFGTLAVTLTLAFAQLARAANPVYLWDGTTTVPMKGTFDGKTVTSTFLEGLVTLTNYVPNAMGPTEHRENNGIGPWVASYVRDSTAAIPLYGGTRVYLYFNLIPDTTNVAVLDSICSAISWFALGVRPTLTDGSVDTTTAGPLLPWIVPTAPFGGMTPAPPMVTEYRMQQITRQPTVWNSLMPGEVLVGLKCADENANGGGIGPTRWVALDFSSSQSPAPQFLMLTLRSFGRWKNNPQASFIRNPQCATKVRCDVVVLP